MKRIMPLLLSVGVALSASAETSEDITTATARELQARGQRVEHTYKAALGTKTRVEYQGMPVNYHGWRVTPLVDCYSAGCEDGSSIGTYDTLEHLITLPGGDVSLRIQDHGADGFAPKLDGLLLDNITIFDDRGSEQFTAELEFSDRDIYLLVDTKDGSYQENQKTLLSTTSFLNIGYRKMLSWLRNPVGAPPLNLEKTARRLIGWLDEARAYYGVPSADS